MDGDLIEIKTAPSAEKCLKNCIDSMRECKCITLRGALENKKVRNCILIVDKSLKYNFLKCNDDYCRCAYRRTKKLVSYGSTGTTITGIKSKDNFL